MSSASAPHGLILSAVKFYLSKDKHAYLVTHITSRKVLCLRDYFPFSHQMGTYPRQIMTAPTASFLLDLYSWLLLWEIKNLLRCSHDGTGKLFQQSLQRDDRIYRGPAHTAAYEEKRPRARLTLSTIQMPSRLIRFLNFSKIISVQEQSFEIPKFTFPLFLK